jgi:peptidoglycan/LPS O-acetylase OafA/YrhL
MSSEPRTEAAKGLPSGYFPTLDGWRAVAILAVMVAHCSHQVFSPTGLYPSHRWLTASWYGVHGVDVFFGISGFLICSRLLQEQQKTGGISLNNFYVRRAFRILPPYLLYLLVAFLLTAIGWLAVQRWEFISRLLFVRNYVPDTGWHWYTGHFWSLAVEEHFYLLWPPALVLLGSRRARTTVFGVAILIAVWRAVDGRYDYFSHLLPNTSAFMRTDIRADALLWGCWMALLFHQAEWRERFARWLSPAVWGGIVAAYLLSGVLHVPLAMMWQSLLMPLILVGTIQHRNWRASRVLESAAFRWVGRISYSLYLWQELFLAPPWFATLGVAQRFPFNIVVTFAVASLSYYGFEKHLMRAGQKMTAAKASGALAVAPAEA